MDASKRRICIYFVVDDAYLPLALVQALRLVKHNQSADIIIFLESSSSPQDFQHPRIQVRCNVLTEYLGKLPRFNDRYNNIIYGRLIAPHLLTEYESALYLDCDIGIFGDPLDRMDAIRSHDFALAAVADSAEINARIGSNKAKQVASLTARGIKPPNYFNSGVILLRPEVFSASFTLKHLQDYLENYREHIRFPDQDFLNHIFQGRSAQLLPRMNFQTPMIKDHLDEAFQPVIYHYYGGLRPWQKNRGLLARRHYAYFRDARLELAEPHRSARIFNTQSGGAGIQEAAQELTRNRLAMTFRHLMGGRQAERRNNWAQAYLAKLSSETFADMLPGEADVLKQALERALANSPVPQP